MPKAKQIPKKRCQGCGLRGTFWLIGCGECGKLLCVYCVRTTHYCIKEEKNGEKQFVLYTHGNKEGTKNDDAKNNNTQQSSGNTKESKRT